MARKKLPPELKAKNHTFKLYDWEVEKVKGFIKKEREEHKFRCEISMKIEKFCKRKDQNNEN